MNDHTNDQQTEAIPTADAQIDQKGLEQDSMTDTTALTPIRGSNGYQQQIEIDPSQPLDLSVTSTKGEIKIQASDQPNVWVVVRRTDGKSDDVT